MAIVALGVTSSPARAQAVQPADVVGVWEGVPGVDPKSPQDTTGKAAPTHAIAIRSDSTWSEVVLPTTCYGGRWKVAGDSVSWIQKGTRVLVHKIVLKDQRLSLYDWKKLTTAAEAYQRMDTTKTPKPRILTALPSCAARTRPAVTSVAPSTPASSTPVAGTPAPTPAPKAASSAAAPSKPAPNTLPLSNP